MRDMSQSGVSVRKRRKESMCHVNCNTLYCEVFPICNFCFMWLSKFPVLDEITFSWCDVIGTPTIQEPFNCFTHLIAGKIDGFAASYSQFTDVRNV